MSAWRCRKDGCVCTANPGDDKRCSGCSHRAKYHKVVDMKTLVTTWHNRAQATKATDAEAEKETNAGLRPKPAAPRTSSGSTKKKPAAMVLDIRTIEMVPYGLNEEGQVRPSPAELRKPKANPPIGGKAPEDGESNLAVKRGLAVVSTLPHLFRLDYDKIDPAYLDERVRQFFADAGSPLFEFLDARDPDSIEPHYGLANKSNRRLSSVYVLNGAELKRCSHGTKKATETSHLYLVLRRRIPSSVVHNLAGALKRLKAGEHINSDSELEEQAPKRTSRRPSSKKFVIDSSSSGSEEGEETESELEGHEVVVKVEKEDKLVSCADDDDDLPPTPRLGPVRGRKRALSVVSVDHKRSRSGSPDADNSDMASIRSISPHLIAPGSSFSFDPAAGPAESFTGRTPPPRRSSRTSTVVRQPHSPPKAALVVPPSRYNAWTGY
ncbi:hypothetical protein C8F01DRAFT_1238474 [Mycena amicta]|nr:hypothetical protein C8F01DRAFT_1238474 [Mycena amicta]